MKNLIILVCSLLIGCQMDKPINRLSEPISFIKDVPYIFECSYDKQITYTLSLIDETTLYIKYENVDKTYIESYFVKLVNDSILDKRFILESESFYVFNPELDDYDVYYLYK